MSTPDPALALVQRLFLAEAPRLRGFAFGLTGDAALADDAVQEAFVVVCGHAGDFRTGSDFTAWVRAIVRRKVLELLRFRGRAGLFGEELVERLAAEAPPPDRWEEERRALAGCVERLAPRARELTELRYLEGLLPEQIAARVRWTVNAVNVALSRTRSGLRACIERRLHGGVDGR